MDRIDLERLITDAIERTEQEAPPPPLETVRKRIAQLEQEAVTGGAGAWWKRWREQWRAVLEDLSAQRPLVAEMGLDVRTTALPTLVTILAILRDADGNTEEAKVAITSRPEIAAEGILVMGVYVVQPLFAPGQELRLFLRDPHSEEEPLGPVAALRGNQEETVAFKLPEDLREEWGDIAERNYEEYPFQFVIDPQPRETPPLATDATG